jgi:hypothetical protein
MLQFAIPQFTVPQFAIPQYLCQYQHPLFDNFFTFKYFEKKGQKIQNSGIAEAQFQ